MALIGHAPYGFKEELNRKPCFIGKSFSKTLCHGVDIIGNGKNFYDDFKTRIHMSYPKLLHEGNGKKNCNWRSRKMDEFEKSAESTGERSETDDKRDVIKRKLRQYYDGRIVRKDLTKQIRECANVPVYVLESAMDLGTVPADLVSAFSLIFYSSPEEAVFKALGVE